MATIALDARKWNDFGIGTYVRCLVEELVDIKSQHQFLLFVHAETLPSLRHLESRVEAVPVAAKSYSLSELIAVSLALRRHGADLFHAVHYTLPAWLPCPAVVTVHDLIHLRFPEFLPAGFRRTAARLYAKTMLVTSTRRAQRVIAPSHHTAQDLEALLRVPRRKLCVVHNGVDRRFSAPAVSTQERDQRLAELGVQVPFALFVGNPKPHKNVARLIDAFAEVVAQETKPADGLGGRHGEPLRLVLAGAPDAARGELTASPRVSGLADRVVVLGKVSSEDLAVLYSAARMFVYPSLYEGFGLPVVEAMAAGTPVISSRGSALAEVCGEAALLVDPLRTAELAAALQQLNADAGLRAELTRRGKARAEQFSWRRAAEQTLAVYDAVLAEAT